MKERSAALPSSSRRASFLSPHATNHLLRSLAVADFEVLHPHLEFTELTKGMVLARPGETSTHVYLPHSGVISQVVRLSEGQTIEVAMIGRDSIVGAATALAGEPSSSEAVVMLSGAASVLAVSPFRAAADRSSAFRILLARHEQALRAQIQQSAACHASHPVEARLARWLLRASDLSPRHNWPLTQEYLAQSIGVQRNAVSSAAHAFLEAGIVSYSRGHIEITNLEALRAASCECYETVRTHYDQLLKLPITRSS